MKSIFHALFFVILFFTVPVMATESGKQPFDEHADFVVNYKLFKLCLTDDTGELHRVLLRSRTRIFNRSKQLTEKLRSILLRNALRIPWLLNIMMP